MGPAYLIIPKTDAEYVSDQQLWTTEGPIGSQTLKTLDSPPSEVTEVKDFTSANKIVYFDTETQTGYIAASDIKAVIDIDTLVAKELDSLSESISQYE